MFDWLLKTNYVQSLILAWVRHAVTGLGVYLVTKGLANDSMVQDFSGFACAAVSFYLSSLDVKVVDTKIKVAYATPVPSSTSQSVSSNTTPSENTSKPELIKQTPTDDPFYNKGGARK